MSQMLSVVLNLHKRCLLRWSRTEHTLVPLLLNQQETVILDESHLSEGRVLYFSPDSFGFDHTWKHFVDVGLLAHILRQSASVYITYARFGVIDRRQTLLVCKQISDSVSICAVDRATLLGLLVDVWQLLDLCQVSSEIACMLEPDLFPRSQPSIFLRPESFGALGAPDHLPTCAVNLDCLLLIFCRLLGFCVDRV